MVDSIDHFLTQSTSRAEAAAGPPEQIGQWSPSIPTPVMGVHSTLLPNGKVLFFTFQPPRINTNKALGLMYIFNPADGTGHSIPSPDNFFCGGHAVLADGRVLMAGGNLAYAEQVGSVATYAKGLSVIYTFNPFNEI